LKQTSVGNYYRELLEQACKLILPAAYRTKILKKYFTKQNSTWTIEGVTYRRTNAPNLSNNDGLSKEIKKSRWRATRTRV
jgi:hypothetical protein